MDTFKNSSPFHCLLFRLPSLLHGRHPGGGAWPGRGGGAGVQHGLGPRPGAWLDRHLAPGQVLYIISIIRSPVKQSSYCPPISSVPYSLLFQLLPDYVYFPQFDANFVLFWIFFACIIPFQNHSVIYLRCLVQPLSHSQIIKLSQTWQLPLICHPLYAGLNVNVMISASLPQCPGRGWSKVSVSSRASSEGSRRLRKVLQ